VPPTSRALVVFTSDKGLAGSVNAVISRRAKALLAESNVGGRRGGMPYKVFTFGTKAKSALERNYGQHITWSINEFAKLKDVTFKQVARVADKIMSEGQDEYTFVYNRFKNLLSNEQVEEKVLNPRVAVQHAAAINSKFDVESGGYRDVLKDLYEFRFAVRVYHVFAENMTTEMSSRMNAMSNSSKAAGEMLNAIRKEYNRTRQGKITTELIEIVSGAVAIEALRD